jgi:hypothetical protein
MLGEDKYSHSDGGVVTRAADVEVPRG